MTVLIVGAGIGRAHMDGYLANPERFRVIAVCDLIEDKATGDFYRVGQAEYTFISLLDGNTTLATAVGTTLLTGVLVVSYLATQLASSEAEKTRALSEALKVVSWQQSSLSVCHPATAS